MPEVTEKSKSSKFYHPENHTLRYLYFVVIDANKC